MQREKDGLVSKREEDYLKAIYEVSSKKGYARVTDIARILGVKPSTVTEMFLKLRNEGLVNYEKYGGATLTEKGKEIAIKLSKTYTILKEFLTILGVDEITAERDAHLIEHVLSPTTAEILTKFVEFMRTRESPRWLERFKAFYSTGKLPQCPKKKE